MAFHISNYQTGSWKVEIMGVVKSLAESVGWTTLENGYADGTYTRWAFRSPASDFCVVYYCLTSQRDTSSFNSAFTNYSLYYTVCESYNTTNHTLIRPAVGTSKACSASDDSLGTSEYSLATVISDYGFEYCNAPVGSTGYIYAACATADYIWLAPGQRFTSGGSNYEGVPAFAGRFNSLVLNVTTNDAYRYVACSPTQGTARATRSAMNANKASHNWALSAYVFTPVHSGSKVVGSPNWDLYQGGVGPTFSQVALKRASTTDIGTFGGLRGTFGNTMISGPTDGSFLDQVVVSGVGTYVKSSTESSYWFLRG